MKHKFDIKKVKVLDDQKRKEFLDPDSILKKLDVDENTIFVEIGAGTGYFSIPASRIVKQVYALDIQDEMLEILNEKIASQQITNIMTIKSRESSLPVPDKTADMVFMANVFHEMEDHRSIIKEGQRVLKDNGILATIDWKKISTPQGPPINHRFSEEEVIRILEANGFEIIAKDNAGPYNYLIISHRKT